MAVSSEVTLRVAPAMVEEDVGEVMACVTISSLISGGVVVTISTADGTAMGEQ